MKIVTKTLKVDLDRDLTQDELVFIASDDGKIRVICNWGGGEKFTEIGTLHFNAQLIGLERFQEYTPHWKVEQLKGEEGLDVQFDDVELQDFSTPDREFLKIYLADGVMFTSSQIMAILNPNFDLELEEFEFEPDTFARKPQAVAAIEEPIVEKPRENPVRQQPEVPQREEPIVAVVEQPQPEVPEEPQRPKPVAVIRKSSCQVTQMPGVHTKYVNADGDATPDCLIIGALQSSYWDNDQPLSQRTIGESNYARYGGEIDADLGQVIERQEGEIRHQTRLVFQLQHSQPLPGDPETGSDRSYFNRCGALSYYPFDFNPEGMRLYPQLLDNGVRVVEQLKDGNVSSTLIPYADLFEDPRWGECPRDVQTGFDSPMAIPPLEDLTDLTPFHKPEERAFAGYGFDIVTDFEMNEEQRKLAIKAFHQANFRQFRDEVRTKIHQKDPDVRFVDFEFEIDSANSDGRVVKLVAITSYKSELDGQEVVWQTQDHFAEFEENIETAESYLNITLLQALEKDRPEFQKRWGSGPYGTYLNFEARVDYEIDGRKPRGKLPFGRSIDPFDAVPADATPDERRSYMEMASLTMHLEDILAGNGVHEPIKASRSQIYNQMRTAGKDYRGLQYRLEFPIQESQVLERHSEEGRGEWVRVAVSSVHGVTGFGVTQDISDEVERPEIWLRSEVLKIQEGWLTLTTDRPAFDLDLPTGRYNFRLSMYNQDPAAHYPKD